MGITPSGKPSGRLLALFAAASYGVNTTLSRLAYDAGTTPLSLTFYRYAMVATLLLLAIVLLRKSWRLSLPTGAYCGAVVGWFMVSIGHLGAVNYIPVSLSAIIFYTFPLQVVAWNRLVKRERVHALELVAFLLAFAGLALALGPEFQQMDWRGLAMAVAGSVGATLFLLCYERFPADADAVVLSAWVTLGSIVLCAMLFLFGFELVPPERDVGWLYLTMIAVFTVIAFVLTIYAIRALDAARVALYMNFEPVVILLLAWIVLHEQLGPERIAGMAMVIVAIFLSQKRTEAQANQ